jgi:hypothetical protein
LSTFNSAARLCVHLSTHSTRKKPHHRRYITACWGQKTDVATGWISAALLTTTTTNNNTTTPQIDSTPIPIMSQASHWMEIYHQAAIYVPSSSHLGTIK